MWPATSRLPVEPPSHPTVEEFAEGIAAPFRLAAFGDQRALADGEFQALVRSIAAREASLTDAPALAAVIDTGDIVNDGKHSDQFATLSEILEPIRRWPYLVAAGNHELAQDDDPAGRRNFVRFMGDRAGEGFAEDRLWYRKDLPGLRILFLDTNDWIYRPDEWWQSDGSGQFAWLTAQLGEDFDGRTIVVMHHPLLISNRLHRGAAARLWGMGSGGRSLATIFADGGVDLVLTGHTHTFEHYRLTAPSGSGFDLVNVSGRPRDGFLWFGDGSRRARDIRGREIEHLVDKGWASDQLEGWTVEQLEGMFDKAVEENQWAEVTVGADGSLTVEMFFLVDRGAGGYESRGKLRLK